MDTIDQDVSDPEMLSRLKLGVCTKFFEALHDSLISRALSSHLPAKSEAGHQILIQSYKKHRSDLLKEVEKYKKLRNQVNRKLQDNF